MEMRESCEDELVARREIAQQQRERDRIGSAGYRGDDARLDGPQRMPSRRNVERDQARRASMTVNCDCRLNA